MVERELKLEFGGDDAARLAGLPLMQPADGLVGRRLRATYFDTAEGDLRRAGLSLRLRDDGTARIQTVKAEGPAAAGLFVRPEWERAVAGELPEVDVAAGPIAAVIGDRPLVPRFTTDIRRRLGLVEWEGARIEVALDEGEVQAGDRASPVAELELELKNGPIPALFSFARALDGEVPLRLGVRTKSERGHYLAEVPADAYKAEPVRLDADTDVAHALAAIAGNALRQFRLNETLLLARDDNAASLHQARVGLRRLRSAFSLFKPLLDGDAQAARLAGGLKTLAAGLGEVRDLDVLLVGRDGAIRAALMTARAEAFGRARDRLEAAEARRLMLDLAEWLAVGDWRTRPADAELAGQPIRPFAADLLDRRRKRVKREGERLAKLDDHGRHQVRIEGKKLRYAAEFFHGLWPGRKARGRYKAFVAAIEALQEELGALNDAAHGAALLHRLGLPADPAPGDGKTAKRARAAYESLIESKRFWR